jgi:hypothetical protein
MVGSHQTSLAIEVVKAFSLVQVNVLPISHYQHSLDGAPIWAGIEHLKEDRSRPRTDMSELVDGLNRGIVWIAGNALGFPTIEEGLTPTSPDRQPTGPIPSTNCSGSIVTTLVNLAEAVTTFVLTNLIQ